MSLRMTSETEDQTFGLARALGKIAPQAVRRSNILAVKAREAESAASQQAKNELKKAECRLGSRTEVREGGLELWPLPGLAPMTRIRTSFGDVHAAALRKGDEVLINTGEFKPIVWLNRICIDDHILNLKPDSNPIVLAAGALGAGVPSAEVMVSPRQIICANDASGLSKPHEASMLISRPGVRRLHETSLSYTMFHVGEAAEVYCEGMYLSFPLEA